MPETLAAAVIALQHDGIVVLENATDLAHVDTVHFHLPQPVDIARHKSPGMIFLATRKNWSKTLSPLARDLRGFFRIGRGPDPVRRLQQTLHHVSRNPPTRLVHRATDPEPLPRGGHRAVAEILCCAKEPHGVYLRVSVPAPSVNADGTTKSGLGFPIESV